MLKVPASIKFARAFNVNLFFKHAMLWIWSFVLKDLIFRHDILPFKTPLLSIYCSRVILLYVLFCSCRGLEIQIALFSTQQHLSWSDAYSNDKRRTCQMTELHGRLLCVFFYLIMVLEKKTPSGKQSPHPNTFYTLHKYCWTNGKCQLYD